MRSCHCILAGTKHCETCGMNTINTIQYTSPRKTVSVTTSLPEFNNKTEKYKLSMNNNGKIVLKDGKELSTEECCKLLNKIENEKENWKIHYCESSNMESILSMDLQIVQEELWDLEKLIYDSYIINEDIINSMKRLKVKIDDLINHKNRIFR